MENKLVNPSLSSTILQRSVPLNDKNWFRTGGPAEYYAEPQSAQEFQMLIIWAQENRKPITLLGEGANILISDNGIAGLVIRPRMCSLTSILVDEATGLVSAGAGIKFPELIDYCLAQQLLGLEEFSGIPGMIGGALFINIHYFQYLLSDFLVHATVIHRTTGELHIVEPVWFEFGYNKSKLQEGEYFLIDATFKLARTDASGASYARGRQAEIIRHRRQRYPNARTCGSFFRNFYETEVTEISNGKKMIYVGYYLDKLGVKGSLQVGGASVSYQHANMIITSEGATSADVITLAQQMQLLVQEAFGILPQPECRLLGFTEHPFARIEDANSIKNMVAFRPASSRRS